MKNRKSRKTLLGGLLLALILASFAVYKLLQSREAVAPREASRRPAPGFELPDSKGVKHTLDSLKGRVVLLHFWAAWCPPCLEEIGAFARAAVKFPAAKVAFVPVSQDPKWEDALKILPSAGLSPNVLSLLDAGGKLSEAYGSYQFPETFLLNARHEIVHKWIGPQNWGSREVQALIEAALPGN